MTLLIIDALNIIRRIHEAVPGADSEEKLVDTITSSLASFKRALKTHSPTHAVAVFDHGGSAWKHALYEPCQANCKPMPENLRAGLQTIKQENRNCATWDCTGSPSKASRRLMRLPPWLTNGARQTPTRVIILSTDKEFLQLLSEQVCIYDHFKGIWRDQAYVLQKFGVKPAQMDDLLALNNYLDARRLAFKLPRPLKGVWLPKTHAILDFMRLNCQSVCCRYCRMQHAD